MRARGGVGLVGSGNSKTGPLKLFCAKTSWANPLSCVPALNRNDMEGYDKS